MTNQPFSSVLAALHARIPYVWSPRFPFPSEASNGRALDVRPTRTGLVTPDVREVRASLPMRHVTSCADLMCSFGDEPLQVRHRHGGIGAGHVGQAVHDQ